MGPPHPETNMLGLVLLLSEEGGRLRAVAEGTLQEDCCANRKKHPEEIYHRRK